MNAKINLITEKFLNKIKNNKLEVFIIVFAFIFPSIILYFIKVNNLTLSLILSVLPVIGTGYYLIVTNNSLSAIGIKINWQSIKEILPGTIAIALIKIFLLWLLPYFRGHSRDLYLQINLFWYFYITVLQEIIWRGLVHLLLEKIFPQQRKIIIISSALLFVLAHLYFKSLLILIGSFILGVFWADNYDKNRSIMGTTISHYSLGSIAIALNYMGIKPNWTIF